MKPSQVTKANEGKAWHTLNGYNIQMCVRFDQVGDRVRISKVKRIFKVLPA